MIGIQDGILGRRKKISMPKVFALWDKEVFCLYRDKCRALGEWKACTEEQQQSVLKEKFRELRMNLKKLIRHKAKDSRRVRMYKLESIRLSNPRGWWRAIHEATGFARKKSAIPNVILDGGTIIRGNDIIEVWRKTFERISQTNLTERYDDGFASSVKSHVRTWISKDGNDQQRGTGDRKKMDLNSWLDSPITWEDVDKVRMDLKTNKATGIDNIVAEIIRWGDTNTSEVLAYLCNYVWEAESVPEDWVKGLIFPFFKGGNGSRLDPQNYRGITLLSVVGKVFAAILNERIKLWCERLKILSDVQCGFRKGRSTLDHIFVLTEVARSRLPATTFACFLDIKSAYDCVFRDGLWYKLHELGIQGKLWRVLIALYKNVQSCVMIGELRSDFFRLEEGLRQGCILSPILFAIFINDLAKEIEDLNLGVDMGDFMISILLFADDIALAAGSVSNLQEMINVAFSYSRKWRFTWNIKKCESIGFGVANNDCEGGDECDCRISHLQLDGVAIKWSSWVKYLGIDFDEKLTWRGYKSRIEKKARATMAMICGMGISNLSVDAAINLWIGLVRSQLEYGAEIWGDVPWVEGDNVQHEMARRILNCGPKTPIGAMMGDLGWWTLRARRDLLRLVFWGKLVLMNSSRLTKKVYLQRKESLSTSRSAQNWCFYTRKLLSNLNLMEYWEHEYMIESIEDWKNLVTRKIGEREQKLWLAGCVAKPKLRTYLQFKSELKLEPYLAHGGHLARSVLFSIRSSSCRLRIETGRWRRPREKEEERICLLCESGEVENEEHFVMRCTRYDDLRQILFSKVLQATEGRINLAVWKSRFAVFKLVVGEGWGRGDGWDEIYNASLNFVFCAMRRRAGVVRDRIV